jgi:hypothetical protein
VARARVSVARLMKPQVPSPRSVVS